MNETTNTAAVADVAKNLALGITKEIAITAAGVATAFVILGVTGTVVQKVQNRVKAKKTETPEN